jgi:tRNA(fMet)-specific endonuclease VapC
MNYLLDTNVCIALLNDSSDKVRARFVHAVLRNSSLVTSSIVAHELWYGVAKSRLVTQNANGLQKFLSTEIKVVDYTSDDARIAGEIRAELERKGKRIGEYDTLIAGQALARNLVLVTANTREFGRIHGLKFEDWTL